MRLILFARYRLARQWVVHGLFSEAEAELNAVIVAFDPRTDDSHRLLRSARSLLLSLNGGPEAKNLAA